MDAQLRQRRDITKHRQAARRQSADRLAVRPDRRRAAIYGFAQGLLRALQIEHGLRAGHRTADLQAGKE